MKKKSQQNKGVHSNGALLGILRKVVPFFFAPPVVHPIRSTRIVAPRPHVRPKKRGSTSKVSRLPSATLTAQKSVKKERHATTSESTLVSTTKKGFILPEEQKVEDVTKITSELLEEAKEDGFLSKVALDEPKAETHIQENIDNDAFLAKVALQKKDETETKKIGAWTLLKSRFFGGKKAGPATQPAAPVLTEEDIKNDSFLSRVQKKEVKSVVGTAIDEGEMSGLEEFADDSVSRKPDAKNDGFKGGLLSAADLRKEAKEAKEATARLEKEVKEIKKEMKKDVSASEKATEKPSATAVKHEEPVEVHVGKHIGLKKKNGFQQFIASIGYIGLGKEKQQFIQNLATMLNAGLPLVEAIKTIQVETRPKPMKKLLQRIVDMVDNGSPLWRAMDAQSFFSPHALALIRIGEEAGNLAGNMTYLAAQDEKDHELKSKVHMAMIYPAIVLSIMAVIIVVLGMFVLPNLIGVLTSLNVPLPLTTRIVIKVSNGFTEYGFIGIPAFLFSIVVLLILNKYTSLKVVVQWVTFRVPGVGKLASQATIARFGVILGGLLKAGVPVTEAMQSLVEVTTIVSFKKLYIRMLDHITIGDSFAKSFAAIKGSEKLLPPSVQQLVITGEKSGALADIMLKISDIYDKKASETAQKLPVVLEPMLLLFIGSLVGTIAFSILVPIYSIVGNVGR